jgi:NADH dehydrogenase
MHSNVPRILILGGGFGGLYCALELERTLARTGAAEVTLVNRENFFLFTPLLHEVAASDLDVTHIVNPIRKLLRRVRFWSGDVEAIDLARRVVRVSHGISHHDHELPYDHLVIALGGVTNFAGVPGLESNALTMKSLGDAIHLRNRLIEHLEQSDVETDPAVRSPLLTVVVAGGGFAGVETVAGIHDFLREAIRYYPNLRERELRTVLVHGGDLLLPELGPALGAYAGRKLAGRGVEIHTRTRVAGFADGVVALSDGSRIASATLVWTAGTAPNPLLRSLPFANARGRVPVDADLSVPGYAGVWAVGDGAEVPDLASGGTCPPTAQHALRQGLWLATNLAAAIEGRSPRPFRFGGLGALAAIGRRTGVARILGVNFSGFLAWWLWRTIYLSKLPRLEKKLRVVLDWTLDLLFSKDLVQFVTFRSGGVSHDDGPALPVTAPAPAPARPASSPTPALEPAPTGVTP